jgi:feruloyl-CoA synthase
VQDAVITGMNRDDVGAMIFPRVDACRALAALGSEASAQDVLNAPDVRAFFAELLTRLNVSATGSATFIARMQLLVQPPSLDRGEITDKGSINQRAVLQHRAALVEALHADDNDCTDILLARRREPAR